MSKRNKEIQLVLAKAGFYHGEIDGDIGNKSKAAMKAVMGRSVKGDRDYLRAAQTILKRAKYYTGSIDGLWGPASESAFEQYLGKKATKNNKDTYAAPEYNVKPGRGKFPTYKNMSSFYGEPGQANMHTRITFPYKMKLAWDLDKKVSRTTVNKKCKAEYEAWFEGMLNHYGQDGITELGLDIFGGLYNKRRIRGGRGWSEHAWAASIDLDPTKNGLHTKWGKSGFSAKEYKFAFDLMNKLGGGNLGQVMGRDLMHFSMVRRNYKSFDDCRESWGSID